MISSCLKGIFTITEESKFMQVFVETDRGIFRIDGQGFYPRPDMADKLHRLASILPLDFRDKTVVEARCNGEDLMLKLEDGSFIGFGWTIFTGTGETIQEVEFYPYQNLDSECADYYNELDLCVEPRADPDEFGDG